jgi:hypothetical protein
VFAPFASAGTSHCARLAFDILVESGPTTGRVTVAKVRLRTAPVIEGLDVVVGQDLRVRLEQGPNGDLIGTLTPSVFTRVEISIVSRSGSQTVRTKVGEQEKQIDTTLPAPAGMYELDLGILPGSGPTTLFIDDVTLDVGTP